MPGTVASQNLATRSAMLHRQLPINILPLLKQDS